MKTVDKYLSDMKKLENIVKRNKRLIILKTKKQYEIRLWKRILI